MRPHHPAAVALLALVLGALTPPRAAAAAAGPLAFPDTPTVERREKGATVAVPRHDFGVVAQQAEVTATLPYVNGGDAEITGLRVTSGCSCFGATVSARTLAPGARGALTVRFRSGSMKGTVDKPLRLLYRIGDEAHVAALRIHARVIAGVLVERVWFGEVRTGATPTASAPIAWFQGVGTPFEITRIEVPGPRVTTRIEPYRVGDGSTYRGWTVHYTFEEPPPKGVYSERAVVHTTHPEHPTVSVPLSANVVGSLWVQSSRVHLGLFPAGTARSASVKIKASGEDAPPLTRVEVRARGGHLRTTVTDGFDPFVGPHKVITVTAPADTPVGAVDDVLEIRTDLPGGEVTEIRVLGRAYRLQGPR